MLKLRFILRYAGCLLLGLFALPVPVAGKVIRVIQFNSQRCNVFTPSGEETTRNAQDVIRVLSAKSPDLVSLNEIQPDQATTIASALGMYLFYARYDPSSVSAVAVLSRTPFQTTQHHRVPNYSPDTFLCLEVSTLIDGQTVRFFSAHPRFNDNAVKLPQMLALMDLLASRSGPRILAGDFNDMDDRPNAYSSRGFINILTGGSHGTILPSTPKLYDLQRKCGIAAQTKNNPPYLGPASDWSAPYNSANTISQWSPLVRIDHIFVSPEFNLNDERNACQALDTMSILREVDPTGSDRYVGDHRPLMGDILLPKPAIQLQLYPNFPHLVLPLGEAYDLKVGGIDTDGATAALFTTDAAQPSGDPENTGRIKPITAWSQSGNVVQLEAVQQPQIYDPYLKEDRPYYNVVRVHGTALGQGTITASTPNATRQIVVKVVPRGVPYEYLDDEAKTVTVAPTGADFTSVRAAVESFNTNGSNYNGTAPKTILITQGGVYEETAPIRLQMDGQWTIRCSNTATRATLVIPSPENAGRGLIEIGDALSPFDDGIAGYVTLENLIVLPKSASGTGVRTVAAKGITADNNANGMLSLNIKNVLISANNGSNAPASDGLAAASGSYTMLASDGLRLFSGVDSLYAENLTVTHCGGAGVNDNGDLVGPPMTQRILGPGCLFSYNGGNGYLLSGGGLSAISGVDGRPVTFLANAESGLRFNSAPNSLGNVSWARFLGNGTSTTGGSGLHLVGTVAMNDATFRNCVFAFNGAGPANEQLSWGNLSVNNSQNTTFTFESCTLVDAHPGFASVSLLDHASGNTSLLFRDSIFAGGGGGGADDVIYVAELGGSLTADHCALVTQGPQALDVTRAGSGSPGVLQVGAGPVARILSPVQADPQFVTLDIQSNDFPNIQAPDYLGRASDGGVLSGAGKYVGYSAGRNWQDYSMLFVR